MSGFRDKLLDVLVPLAFAILLVFTIAITMYLNGMVN